MIRNDGVPGRHGEVARKFVHPEPTHFLGLVRFAIPRFAFQDSPQIRGRNPMLAFFRQQVIGDAEQAIDGNLQTDFFQRLANRAAFNGFQKIDFPSDDAPALRFGREFAQGQQHPAAGIDEQNSCSHARLRIGDSFRCGCGFHRSRFDTHLATEGSGAVFSWDKSCSTLSCTMTISL